MLPPVMEPTVKPTRVCIIESLRSTDHNRTGHTLFKRLDGLFGAEPGGLQVQYREAQSEAEFLAALQEVEQIARGHDADPLLHIECHGSAVGLHLGDDTTIPWERVGELFLPINEATRNHLFVVLAACFTVPVVQLFAPTRRAAFWHMIVSHREAYPSEILDSLWAFYSKLHETRHAQPALDAMTAVSDVFGYTDGAFIMKSVYEEHLKNLNDPDYFKDRARRVVDERLARGDPGLNIASRTLYIDTLMIEYRRDPVEMFRKLAETYFWLDRFPENQWYFDREFPGIVGATTATTTKDT